VTFDELVKLAEEGMRTDPLPVPEGISYYIGDEFIYVPKEQKTAELCHAVVQWCYWAIHYVPEEYKTAELCLAAVKNDSRALEYVPEEYKTPELYLKAEKSQAKH